MTATTRGIEITPRAYRSVAGRVDDDADPAAIEALARAEPALAAHRRPSDPGPSGTRTIQRDYEASFYKRFRRLKGLIRETVAVNDAFRLTPNGSTATGGLDVQAEPARDFGFVSDDQKVEAFLDWLQAAEDDEILEVLRRTNSGSVAVREEWQDVFVRRAYAKGAEYGNARLREQGVDVDGVHAAGIFNKPIHADALGVLGTRNFRELKGITDEMDRQITRELLDGFSQGEGPRAMATRINDRVDKVGLSRARTLARTETMNAHSTATLNRYEEILGPDAQVTGSAEWRTAGDGDVCTICQGLEGTRYTLDEARGLIPIHPNCRCTWVPVIRRPGGRQRLT